MRTLTPDDQPKFEKTEGWAKLSPGLSFRMVSNIAADSQERIYVVHRGPKPLRRFDLDGNYLGSVADSHLIQSVNYDLDADPPRPIGKDFWLHGLHLDPWDHIWVTDIGRHLVFKFDLEGELLLTLGTPDEAGEDPEHFYQPTQVVVGPSGNVYVSDGYGNSRVVKFSAAGEFVKTWGRKGSGQGEFNLPHCIAVDSDENIYVAERLNDRVQVFDSEGSFRGQWTGLERADAICVLSGSALVGTGGTRQIFQFELSGKPMGALGPRMFFNYPHGIYVDREGSLYVADPVFPDASLPPLKFVPLS